MDNQVERKVIQPPTKGLLGCQQLGDQEGPTPISFRGGGPCRHLDFELLASRTVIQYVSVGLSHLIGGVLSQQPWEMNRIGDKL